MTSSSSPDGQPFPEPRTGEGTPSPHAARSATSYDSPTVSGFRWMARRQLIGISLPRDLEMTEWSLSSLSELHATGFTDPRGVLTTWASNTATRYRALADLLNHAATRLETARDLLTPSHRSNPTRPTKTRSNPPAPMPGSSEPDANGHL